MTVSSINSIVLRTLLPCVLIFATHQLIKHYHTKEESKFSSAAKELGFKTKGQQQALIKILYLHGYLQPEKVWHDLNQLGFQNPDKIFKSIYSILKTAKTYQPDINRFDAQSLIKNLFKEIPDANTSDIKDFILYITQNAFGRAPGQETNELTTIGQIEKSTQEYLAQSKILNLIDRVEPKLTSYDAAWITGASRIGLLTRSADLKRTIEEKEIAVKNGVQILAGERLLWAEIDGVNPNLYKTLLSGQSKVEDLPSLRLKNDSGAVDEGKIYLQNLAAKNDILLDEKNPFVVYTKENCPAGFFPGRFYPNYAKTDSPKLTEAIMAEDIKKQFWPNDEVIVIDTKAENTLRPTTITTARDAAQNFVQRILNRDFGDQKTFHIILQSNNPYIQRQAFVTQREVNKALAEHNLKDYKVHIEGIGFGLKQDITPVASELACLIAEKWRDSQEKKPSSRDVKDLLYQTRQELPTEHMPDLQELESSFAGENYFESIFNQISNWKTPAF